MVSSVCRGSEVSSALAGAIPERRRVVESNLPVKCVSLNAYVIPFFVLLVHMPFRDWGADAALSVQWRSSSSKMMISGKSPRSI